MPKPNDSFSTKQKQEITDIVTDVVVEALNDIVIPVLSDMTDNIKTLKEDVSVLKEDVSYLKEKTERIDKKIYMVTDSQSDKLDDHERRIKKLEKKPAPN